MIVAQALLFFLSTAAAFLAPQATITTTRVSLLFFSSTTANNNNNKNIGLVKTIARPGQGPSVQPGDICTVKYSLYDNNSNNNKVPYSKASAQKVVLDGSYIPGFECAIQGMTVGEVATFVLPPTLGYGPFSGVPSLIPSNATLRLEMELLDTNAMSANIDFDEIANADSTPVSVVLYCCCCCCCPCESNYYCFFCFVFHWRHDGAQYCVVVGSLTTVSF